LGDGDTADRPPAYDSADARYFGPFGQPPTQSPASGAYQLPDATYPAAAASWPPPEPVRGPRTGSHGVNGRPGRGARPGMLVAVAAVTALLVGGAAGYGGALLAGRGEVATAAPSASASAPGGNGASPAPTTAATPSALPAGPMDTVAVAARALPGTVTIQVGRATGSGFVMDDQGRILTNNHVVAGAADGGTIRVAFSDGRRQTATLVGRSPSYDLAVIKVKPAGYLRPLATGDSEALRVGEPVLALGAPLGLPDSVSQGIVSAVDRPVVVQADGNADAPFAFINGVQTDAAINPGSSGGPLVDAQARVIGINSAILTRGSSDQQSGNIGVGFAIPINQAKTIADLLITRGKATYPVIGAELREVTGGLVLSTVDPNGPAGRAGLREGDLVTKIDDRRVDRTEELIVQIRTRRPGEKVVLEYERGNARERATVTLGSREG
jgi:putative serine protease PepD